MMADFYDANGLNIKYKATIYLVVEGKARDLTIKWIQKMR